MTTLNTERLLLRPLCENDLVALAAAVNNPRIVRNLLRLPWPYRLDDARSFLAYTQNLPPASAIFALAARQAGTPVIGTIGYETHSGRSELGYWLAEEHWGRGLMREAADAVVDHAFAAAGLMRIQSRCFLGNEASRRLLLALGFRPTGTAADYAPAQAAWVITQEFELGAKEWRLLRTAPARSKKRAP